MTDEQSTSKEQTPESSGSLRKVILYGLLALMLCALGYDYGVARPAVNAAYDKILKENERINQVSTEKFTNKDVAKLIGMEPAKTTKDGPDLVEEYHFAAGIPGRPHKLYAVYKMNDGDQMFYRQSKFVYEKTSAVSKIGNGIVLEGEDTSEDYTDEEMGMGGPGPDGGGGGDAAPDGRPEMEPDDTEGAASEFNAESMFKELDADGDGQLSGSEIPDTMNVEQMDLDKDQIISSEEFSKGMGSKSSDE